MSPDRPGRKIRAVGEGLAKAGALVDAVTDLIEVPGPIEARAAIRGRNGPLGFGILDKVRKRLKER